MAADALELRHGVVRRIHSAIPYFRVQHIDVAQGPFERAVGLSRLVLHTASAGTDATIPGIAAGDAEACAASSWPGPATAMPSEDPGAPRVLVSGEGRGGCTCSAPCSSPSPTPGGFGRWP